MNIFAVPKRFLHPSPKTSIIVVFKKSINKKISFIITLTLMGNILGIGNFVSKVFRQSKTNP